MSWNLLLPLAQANEVQSLGDQVGGLWKLVITAACIALAYLVGRLVSRWARLPDYSWKASLITFSLLAGSAIVILGWPPKFGIDLYGGVNLVYEVDRSKVNTDLGDVNMEQLISAVRLRVDPTGTKQITIRPYGQNDAVEIIVPRISQAEVRELKDQIVNLGTLELRITANTRDHADVVTAARAVANNVKTASAGQLIAEWVPVVNKERTLDYVTGAGGTFIWRTVPVEGATGDEPEERTEVLIINDVWDVTGDYLRRVAPGRDEQGRPSVNFTLDSEGARRFTNLTRANVPDDDGYLRNLAVVLSGELYNAPTLNEVITDQGEIAGEFSKEEQESLLAVLNAGSLPAALNKTPLREQQISPTLGQDTINRGQIAMAVSMGIVLVFVLIYYRFAGVVACLALLTNLVLILATMISINAAFTLPGLAALVLTVGMAVDANVLIYERIREELSRGAALRMAIRNGFARATTTIVDANLTTLITAVVLYAIGTDQIKGFAVTLILGILMSMYSAVFCSRAVFEIGERTRRIKKLNMMRMFTATNFNFLGKKMICGVVSIVLIVVGMAAVVMRGSGVLDIDFTGGSQCQILFAADGNANGDEYDTAYVRTKIEEWNQTVADEANSGGLQTHLEGTPGLVGSLRDALREQIIAELKPGYIDEELDRVADIDDEEAQDNARIEIPNIVEERATNEAESRLDAEFDKRLVELASISDLSVAAVTYIDDQPHNPEFIVNTSNKVLLAVETILSEVFKGELQTNTLTYSSIAAVDADGFLPIDDNTTGDDTATGGDDANANDANNNATGGNANAAGDDGAASGDDSTGDGSTGGGLTALGGFGQWRAAPMALTSFVALQDPPTGQGDDGQPPVVAPPENQGGDANQATDTQTGDNQTGDDQATDADNNTIQDDTNPLEPAPQQLANTTRFELSFGQAIGAQDVTALIKEVAGEDVMFELSGDEYTPNSTQTFQDWDVDFTNVDVAEGQAWLTQVQANVAARSVFPATNNIGSQVAGDTRNIGIAAMIASLFFVVVYIWIRFQKVSYGLAAVVALVHDVLITLGFVALSAYLTGIPTIDAFKINLEMLAAFLTLVGYSLNDTIVIFDRIREVKGKSPRLTEEMVNTSVNQTLSRTILTSGTTLVVVAILFFFGGQGVHGFSFALFVGVIVGTYSSVFVAAPVLLWLTRSDEAAIAGSRRTSKLKAGGHKQQLD